MCMSCAYQMNVTYDPALKSRWLNDRVSVDRIQSQRLDTSFKIFFLCSTFIKDNKDIFVYVSYLFKLFSSLVHLILSIKLFLSCLFPSLEDFILSLNAGLFTRNLQLSFSKLFRTLFAPYLTFLMILGPYPD